LDHANNFFGLLQRYRNTLLLLFRDFLGREFERKLQGAAQAGERLA
jgi:hypothetical protein